MNAPLGGIVVTIALTLAVGGCQRKSENEAVTIRGVTWTVEVVRDAEARARGLSGRESLPTRHGMLFVFDRPEVQEFWMMGCRIPLDIAFISADLRVLNVCTMQVESPRTLPNDYRRYASAGKVLYALEVEAGGLRAVGVQAGDSVIFSPGLAPSAKGACLSGR